MRLPRVRVPLVRRGPSRRAREREEVEAFERALLRTLEAGSCPVCAQLVEHEPHYLFWLLTESYQELGVQEGVARALGYCPAHAARLLEDGAYSSAVLHLHTRALDALVGRLNDALARPDRESLVVEPLVSAQCPGCASRTESESRNVGFITRAMGVRETAARYGAQGILCYPHFAQLLQELPRPAVKGLVVAHAERLGGLLSSRLSARRERPAPDDPRGAPDDLRATAALLTANAYGAERFPDFRRRDPRGTARLDSRARLEGALGGSEDCVVCDETHAAWIEWMGWLEERAAEGLTHRRLSDLLPTCSLHVSAALRSASPALSAIIVTNLAETTAGRLHTARRFVRDPNEEADPDDAPLIMRLRNDAERAQAAAEVVGRAIPCGVCERLRVVVDRSLELVAALLRQARHRSSYEQGYGLCVRHFARAHVLRTADPAGRSLIELELAKLSLLHWECEEYARKRSWSTRPEAEGTEAQAPLHLARKLAGTGLG